MSAISPIPPLGPLDGVGASSPAGTVKGPAGGDGFGDLLGGQLDKLQTLQNDAAAQSQALATGKADDVATVSLSVERASLALQLAAQVRNKLVDAYSEILRMQV